MTPEVRAACPDAVHVYTPDGRWLKAGEAATYLVAAIGYKRLAALMGLPVIRTLVEVGYHWVANHRVFLGKFLFTRE